ncbi:MAG: hypothetical protein NT084_15245 [Bacteroidetes bacterium]|nr:hypothetical protein [Bacteroidota bacterium]
MKSFLLFLSSLIFLSANAQEVSEKHKNQKLTFKSTEPSKRDTIIPAGRNEFYLNTAPVFSSMLGGYQTTEARYSLYYKRVLKNPRMALRFGVMYRPERRTSNSNLYDTWYFNTTDTSRIANVFARSPENKWQLNVGLEWRSKKVGRWSTFWGCDLLGGFYSGSYSLYNVQQTLAPNGHWTSSSDNFGNVFTSNFVQLDHQRSFGWYAGVSPFFGARYAFNSHWMISAQTGFDAYLMGAQSFGRNTTATALIHENYNSYNFNIPSLINQFDLVYRFGNCKKKNGVEK